MLNHHILGIAEQKRHPGAADPAVQHLFSSGAIYGICMYGNKNIIHMSVFYMYTVYMYMYSIGFLYVFIDMDITAMHQIIHIYIYTNTQIGR